MSINYPEWYTLRGSKNSSLFSQRLKKTALASAITLALAGVNAWAVTTSNDVGIISDKTEVRAGEVVNVTIMALDGKEGKVDRFGEQDGAVLIATVKSKLGKVIGGSDTPGETEKDSVEFSNFSPDAKPHIEKMPNIKYVRLIRGIGRIRIQYPVDTQFENSKGEVIKDEITVLLQQRYENNEGGVRFDDIAGIGRNPHNDCPPFEQEATGSCPFHEEPFEIDVLPPSVDPGGLDIVAFLPPLHQEVDANEVLKACKLHGRVVPRVTEGVNGEVIKEVLTADKYGMSDCYVDVEPTDGDFDNEDGIQGVMTAGLRGGRIVIKADNSSVNGTIRLKLRQVADLMAMEGPNPQVGANAIRMMQDYLPRDANGNLIPIEHTFTARMIQGEAIVLLDERLTKASNYFIEAEFKVGDDAETDKDGDGYAFSSVDMVHRDTLKIVPTGIPETLRLTSLKQRMSTEVAAEENLGIRPGTPLEVTYLDAFGNPTVLADAMGNPTTLKITDSSNVANNALTPGGVVELVIPPNDTTSEPMQPGGEWLGDDEIFTIGASSEGVMALKATAVLPDGTELSSGTVNVTVQDKYWLHADASTLFFSEGAPRAGDDFEAFKVIVFNNTTTPGSALNPGRMVIQNVSTKEESVSLINASTQILEARFKNATVLGSQQGVTDSKWHKKWYRWFLVSDEEGKYPQVLYQAPTGIGTNAGVSVKLYDAHGVDPSENKDWVDENGATVLMEEGSLTTVVTSASGAMSTKTVIPQGAKGRGDIKYLDIPEFALKMTDCFGNPVTAEPVKLTDIPISERDRGTGTFTLRSSNATVSYTTPETENYGVPYRDYYVNVPTLEKSRIALKYDTTKFQGDDRIEVRFTKPGLQAGGCRDRDAANFEGGANPFIIETTVGRVDEDIMLAMFVNPNCGDVDDSEVNPCRYPIESEVPLRIESLVADGVDADGEMLYRVFSDYENILATLSVDIGDNEETWLPDLWEIQCEFFGINQSPPEICEERPVSPGDILDFTTDKLTGTNGRKVLVLYSGPVQRKPFTLTFTDINDENVTVSRELEVVEMVSETIDRECSTEFRGACRTQETCEEQDGIWDSDFGLGQCKDPEVVCMEEQRGLFVDNTCFYADPPAGKDKGADLLQVASSVDPDYGDDRDATIITQFSGGLMNKSNKEDGFSPGSIDAPVSVTLNDNVLVQGLIKVKAKDVTKRADIVVAGIHWSDIYPNGAQWYMMVGCTPNDTIFPTPGVADTCPSIGWYLKVWETDEEGNPILSELQPLEQVTFTSGYYPVRMYEGNFIHSGELDIYFGYIINDPDSPKEIFDVVYNIEPIYVNIEK